jgi:hypothetical protein
MTRVYLNNVAYLLKARTVEPEKQPVRNNRGIVTIQDVTRTAVAMEQLSEHVSTYMNTRNSRTAVFCAVRAEGL